MTADGLAAGVFEISPDELVSHLLIETGQDSIDAVNTASILEYLQLSYLEADFARDLSFDHVATRFSPRALISFPDRLVAVDSNLTPNRIRFSALHEIAHFILPAHQHALYLCDESALSANTNLKLEAQANQVAASLMFKGSNFTIAANSTTPSAVLIKELANKFNASFEATARRLVEKNLRPVMLVVFKIADNHSAIDPTQQPLWNVRYCITSPAFRSRYFSDIAGSPPAEIAATVASPGRDISHSISVPIQIDGSNDEKKTFNSEWFWNTYNIMALITPSD